MLSDAKGGFDVAWLLRDWKGDDEGVDVLVEEEVVVVGTFWGVFGVDCELRRVFRSKLLCGSLGAGEDGFELKVLAGLDGWLGGVRLRLE